MLPGDPLRKAAFQVHFARGIVNQRVVNLVQKFNDRSCIVTGIVARHFNRKSKNPRLPKASTKKDYPTPTPHAVKGRENIDALGDMLLQMLILNHDLIVLQCLFSMPTMHFSLMIAWRGSITLTFWLPLSRASAFLPLLPLLHHVLPKERMHFFLLYALLYIGRLGGDVCCCCEGASCR